MIRNTGAAPPYYSIEPQNTYFKELDSYDLAMVSTRGIPRHFSRLLVLIPASPSIWLHIRSFVLKSGGLCFVLK